MDLQESLGNILGRNCEKICYIPVYHSLTFLTGDDMSVTNHFERLKKYVFLSEWMNIKYQRGGVTAISFFLIATLRFNGATTTRSSKKKNTTTTQKTTNKGLRKMRSTCYEHGTKKNLSARRKLNL